MTPVKASGHLHPESVPGRGTPLGQFRVPPDVWARFGEAARAEGTDRAALLRAFIAWYLGESDEKLERPRRPKKH